MITQEYLHLNFLYDPYKGLFMRRYPRGKQKRGDASNYNDKGYSTIRINGKGYSSNRLACLYMLGYMPEVVDILDKDPTNTAWYNLVPTTKSKSTLNNKAKGVSLNSNGKWTAYIQVDKKHQHLGTFDTKEEALEAREEKLLSIYPELIRVR